MDWVQANAATQNKCFAERGIVPMNIKSAWSRRSFLSTFSAAIGGLWSVRNVDAATLVSGGPYGPLRSGGGAIASGLGSSGDIYAELGVTPVINGAGTYTVLGGSLMHPEVIEVMRLGNEKFVDINDLEVAAGKKMAELCKMPEGYTGLVTTGAAAALLVGYAAILTGDNKQYIQQIPDLTGMPKSEVIIQKSHRYPFDHQVRQTGVKLIEVETRDELIAAINPRTAALHFTNLFNDKGQVKVDEFVKIAHQHNLPAIRAPVHHKNLHGLRRQLHALAPVPAAAPQRAVIILYPGHPLPVARKHYSAGVAEVAFIGNKDIPLRIVT